VQGWTINFYKFGNVLARLFMKLFGVCGQFHDLLIFQIWLDLLEGFQSCGGTLGCIFPELQRPVAVKLCVGFEKVLRGRLVRYAVDYICTCGEIIIIPNIPENIFPLF